MQCLWIIYTIYLQKIYVDSTVLSFLWLFLHHNSIHFAPIKNPNKKDNTQLGKKLLMFVLVDISVSCGSNVYKRIWGIDSPLDFFDFEWSKKCIGLQRCVFFLCLCTRFEIEGGLEPSRSKKAFCGLFIRLIRWKYLL